MHQYLKAIGFGPIKKKAELKEILEQTRETFTHQMTVSYNEEADYCEFQKEYGQDVGISLIFTMQNGVEYMKERQLGMMTGAPNGVTFSGLALSGRILLPVRKSETQMRFAREEAKTRKQLLSAARNGDQGAIETLTLEDMDIYSKVSRRLATEDVYSIVDSYFMPYGVECDLYSIMGEILAIRERENTLTGERLYQMKLDVNELEFDVCVPKKEVLGEPEIGRRFKGEIWLQGYVNF